MSQSAYYDQQISPIWEQLSSKPLVDRSIINYEFTPIFDEMSGTGLNKPSTNIKFNINIGDNYYLLPDAYLNIRFKIQKPGVGQLREDIVDEDYGDVAADVNANFKNIAFASNPLYLFREFKFFVASKLVEHHDNPGHKAEIYYLMSTPPSAVASKGRVEGFMPDTGDGLFEVNKINVATGNENYNYNKGFDERARLCKNSKVVQVQIPLNRIIDLFKHCDVPFIGHNTTLEFVPNDKFQQFIMMDTPREGFEPVITFEKMELWVPTLSPDIATEAKILETMVKGDTQTNLLYSYVRTHTSPPFEANQSQINWTMESMTTVPTDITIIALLDKQTNNSPDTYVENPSKFNHCNITQLSLNIAAKKFPQNTYEINFNDGEEDYVRVYNDFISSEKSVTSKTFVESLVGYEDYKRIHSIFHFDLSKFDVTAFGVMAHNLTVNVKRLPIDMGDKFRLYAFVGRERQVQLRFVGEKKIMLDITNE